VLQSWSKHSGVDPNAHNLVASEQTPEADKHRYYHVIHAEGKSDIKRTCDDECADTVYIAPSYNNGAEHPRWINRNWDDIFDALARTAQGNYYRIKLPTMKQWKDFDFLTWFILSNMKE